MKSNCLSFIGVLRMSGILAKRKDFESSLRSVAEMARRYNVARCYLPSRRLKIPFAGRFVANNNRRYSS